MTCLYLGVGTRSSGGDINEGLPPSSSRTAEPEPELLPTHYTNPNGTIELSAAQVSAYEEVLSLLATDACEELRSTVSSGNPPLLADGFLIVSERVLVVKDLARLPRPALAGRQRLGAGGSGCEDPGQRRVARCDLPDLGGSDGAGTGCGGQRRSGAGDGPSKGWVDRDLHQRAALPNAGGWHVRRDPGARDRRNRDRAEPGGGYGRA